LFPKGFEVSFKASKAIRLPQKMKAKFLRFFASPLLSHNQLFSGERENVRCCKGSFTNDLRRKKNFRLKNSSEIARNIEKI